MFRDYMLVSPSLDGILRHESISYDDLRRPPEIALICDRPGKAGKRNAHDHQVLETYFHDLHGVFMKKLSSFVIAAEYDPTETLKLQAVFQELLKIKMIIVGKKEE